ncbi:hypothetical protein [Cyanobium sp. ATX-6F1]|uniref:hypothetical protein n=1 Tax=Cyanobium sp. ATX-6F1 TaxID=3137388 RepID=UPI0039BE6BEA
MRGRHRHRGLQGHRSALANGVGLRLLAHHRPDDLRQRPATSAPLWSALLGALVGSLVGAGTVAADLVSAEGFTELAPQRALIVGSLALAGIVSGALLGGVCTGPPCVRPAI